MDIDTKRIELDTEVEVDRATLLGELLGLKLEWHEFERVTKDARKQVLERRANNLQAKASQRKEEYEKLQAEADKAAALAAK